MRMGIHWVRLTEYSSKDTASMFLLHWCLSGVNGFADAVELVKTEKKKVIKYLLICYSKGT